jgi:hypothetical protein
MCQYFEPSVQSKCSTDTAGKTAPASSYRNFSLGYIAVKGTKALVATLGTDCEAGTSPQCVTNSDPASIFSSAKSFDTLWTESVAAAISPVHAYSLIPCVQTDSHWYLYLPPSTF